MKIVDWKNKEINLEKYENPEQKIASSEIHPDDCVLELGARFGVVSCIVNKLLNNKTQHVVVEPDKRVWEALHKNKLVNNCQFEIVEGFISSQTLDLNYTDKAKGVATWTIKSDNSTIPSYTLAEIMQTYKIEFNVLIADCEGFLEQFYDENPEFFKELRLIIFEADRKRHCNYKRLRKEFEKLGFIEIINGHQNVWEKVN